MTTTDIEHYIRCSVTAGKWTVEPGIEFRDGDDEDRMHGCLEPIALSIAESLQTPGERPMAASMASEPWFRGTWPGRAFFIEIHSTDHRWTQTFQPYGVPRRQPDPLSDKPNLWRDLYATLSERVAMIHTTLGGGPEELAEDAAKRAAATMQRLADRLNTVHQSLSGMLGENVEDAAKRVVADRDFHMRKVYDAVDAARRAKDELDACREELRVATADRDRHSANEDRLLDLNTQLSKELDAVVAERDALKDQLDAELRARSVHLASLDSWRTQAQSLGNQVLAARDAIDGRNADTLAEAILSLRLAVCQSANETLRQAVLRVLSERDDLARKLKDWTEDE